MNAQWLKINLKPVYNEAELLWQHSPCVSLCYFTVAFVLSIRVHGHKTQHMLHVMPVHACFLKHLTFNVCICITLQTHVHIFTHTPLNMHACMQVCVCIQFFPVVWRIVSGDLCMLGERIPLSCILSLCTYMLSEYITSHMIPPSFAI